MSYRLWHGSALSIMRRASHDRGPICPKSTPRRNERTSAIPGWRHPLVKGGSERPAGSKRASGRASGRARMRVVSALKNVGPDLPQHLGAGTKRPMRVAVIHNLLPGGARRRLSEQLASFECDVVEVCPSTAEPILESAQVVDFGPLAPHIPRPLRVPVRYADLVALMAAWRRVAARVAELQVDVVYANPCRYLQAPAALLSRLPPSLYFCDEPRRVDTEEAAKASRNPITRPVYWPMYSVERHVDRRGVMRATHLATNSLFTAAAIRAAYGRRADVIPMGVSGPFRHARRRPPTHILSVGTLIPSKGHDIAILAAARAKRRWPVVIVAAREDTEGATRLRALARAAGVELRIRIGISDRELAELYASAYATLYMAELEPFGLASLEAQAAGSPVIVSAEGGLPETIAPDKSGWAVPRKPDVVSAHLDRLAAPGIHESLSAGAREHAASATWLRSARAVEGLLAQLSAQQGGA
jgi:glycosyltransferase involved in cell wall biosynthesis